MSEYSEDLPDTELRAELSHLLRRIDPMPQRAVRAAEAAFAWVPDAADPVPRPLVERDPEALAGAVRGATDASRMFRYRTTTVRVAQLSTIRCGYQLAGIVAPATAHEVAVAQTPDGEYRCTLDGSGHFRLDGLRHGPLRIMLTGATEPAMATGWFVW